MVFDSDDMNAGGMVMPDRGSLPYEIHYLDVKTNLWETVGEYGRLGYGRENLWRYGS